MYIEREVLINSLFILLVYMYVLYIYIYIYINIYIHMTWRNDDTVATAERRLAGTCGEIQIEYEYTHGEIAFGMNEQVN